jgi:hypothetical protein
MNAETNTEKTNNRELLMKLFKSQPGEKTLSEKEFEKVKDLISLTKGGLKLQVFHQFKNDKELIRAARDHQLAMSKTLVNVKEVREPLLRLLKSPLGEKNLTLDEYKKVIGLIKSGKGGLTQRAYDLFKEDKEIISAAQEHRSVKSESLKEVAEKTERGLSELQKRKSQEKAQTAGIAPGD